MDVSKKARFFIVLLCSTHAIYSSQKKSTWSGSKSQKKKHTLSYLAKTCVGSAATDSGDTADISSSESEIEKPPVAHTTEYKMSIIEKDRNRAVQEQRTRLLNEILALENLHDVAKLQKKAYFMKININNGHTHRPSWTHLQPKIVKVYGKDKQRSVSY